jgi:hypothetical protein
MLLHIFFILKKKTRQFASPCVRLQMCASITLKNNETIQSDNVKESARSKLLVNKYRNNTSLHESFVKIVS